MVFKSEAPDIILGGGLEVHFANNLAWKFKGHCEDKNIEFLIKQNFTNYVPQLFWINQICRIKTKNFCLTVSNILTKFYEYC